MIMHAQENNLIPLEGAVERYGISAQRIQEANQHYPEIIKSGGLRQLVYVDRLGAAKDISYDEMLQMGFKISDRFPSVMQSWFDNNNLELSLDKTDKILVAKARRYWEEFLKLTHKKVHRLFKGQDLYDICLDYSKNGNPNGSYLRTEIREEVRSNLELLGDIIIGYSGYDVKKMNDGQLLREYKATNSLSVRDELVERYFSLVKSLANEMKYKINPTVQLGDLISGGTLKLMEAIEVYDPDRGIKFKTLAMAFIKGGIKDEIRDTDVVPNHIRRIAGKMRGAREYLFCILGRQPDDIEMMEHLGVDEDKYRKMTVQLQSASVSSIESPIEFGGAKAVSLKDFIEDYREELPDARIMRKDMVDVIERGFSRREKLLLILYKGEEFNMADIGNIIGVKESRVCQILKELKPKLQEKIEQNPHWKKDYLDKEVVL